MQSPHLLLLGSLELGVSCMVRGQGLKALTSQFPWFHFYLFPSPTFICTDVWRYPASYCVDRGTIDRGCYAVVD